MQQKNYRRSNEKKDLYVYGNAVKNLSAMPAQEPQKRDRRDLEQEKNKKRLQHKEAQRIHRINLLYTFAVVGVVAFIFTVCIQYLELQASVKGNSSAVANLEVQLNEMTEKNDATELQIDGSIDYNKILDTAINELGMQYPNKKQVVEYKSSQSEYVKQFSDIPSTK